MMPISDAVYQIRLDEKIMQVDFELWNKVRHKVRNNEWFYLVYNDVKYKYIKDREYMRGPTMFCFITIKEGDEQEIEIITIG